MSAPTSTISVQNGNQAASNVTSGSTAYVDPGNQVTFALQSSTGVSSWVMTLISDYGPLNGYTYTVGATGPFTVSVPMPQTPCKLTVSSVVTDGNNAFPTTNFVYATPRVTVPDRSVRCVQTTNQNLTAVNVLVTIDGVTLAAGDRVLCVNQTTTAQNGPYVFTAPVANIGTFVRPSDYGTGFVSQTPPTFEVAEGTSWGGTTWKDMTASNGYVTVDTTNVTFYPRVQFGKLANIANSTTATANSWIWTNAVAICTSVNTVNACKTTTVNAGAGTGNVTFACASANDGGQYIIFNW